MVSVDSFITTSILISTRCNNRAAAHVFQKPPTPDSLGEHIDAQIASSTLVSYLGLDKREGLVKIGRRLLEGTPVKPRDPLTLINLRQTSNSEIFK